MPSIVLGVKVMVVNKIYIVPARREFIFWWREAGNK